MNERGVVGRYGPIGLAAVLALPSLWVGLRFDDHQQRAVLRRAAGPGDAMMRLFTFLDGNPAHARSAMDGGALPWWTLPESQQAFWRPLAAFTHWLDYALWPNHPWAMHAHSLLWFAALIGAAGALYRRLPPLPGGAGARGAAGVAALAGLLYAVDDAHGFAVGWLANRNALMAALFGVLCVRSHVRWRRGGRPRDGVAAALWFALGLLSSEAAIAAPAYIAAYAIWLDRGGWRRRLGACLPSLLVGVGWAAVYGALGFGARGTAYVDPLAEPLHFARAVALRGPLLLLGQWALPPAEVAVFLHPAARLSLWWLACLVLAGLAWLILPTLRRSATARFWATGMLLAVIPSCAAPPANRLLFFAGLGAMGVLAEALSDERTAARSGAARAGARALAAIHLGLAPVLLPVASVSPALLGGIERAGLGVPASAAAARQTDVFVHAPSFFAIGLLRTIRADHGLPTAGRVRYLGAGVAALDVTRHDERTLIVRPVGGYLGGLDPLFRGADHPLALGQSVALAGMTASVLALTPDGRPALVAFRFSVPLDDPSLRWFEWRDGRYAPFVVPAVGQARHLPAARLFSFGGRR